MTNLIAENSKRPYDIEKYAPRAARVIACKLIHKAIKAGLVISVNDGEEWTVKKSGNAQEVIAALASTEMDILKFRNAAGESLGSVSLIWGNDEDVISDYSDLESMANLLAGI